MSNRPLSTESGAGARRSRAWLPAFLAIAVLAPALVYALPAAMQARSALHWILGGQTLIVTVAEVGDTDESSLVSIEIRDAANVVKASALSRTLVSGKPVIISTQVPRALQLLAVVTVSTPDTDEIHQPTVSMDVFDPLSLTIKTLPPCAVPIEQMPSAGGGAEGNCGGWHLTSPTSGAN